MGREMKAAGAWSQGILREHYSRVRLDNPAIPARREAITQEVAQLTLEETRQNCGNYNNNGDSPINISFLYLI